MFGHLTLAEVVGEHSFTRRAWGFLLPHCHAISVVCWGTVNNLIREKLIILWWSITLNIEVSGKCVNVLCNYTGSSHSLLIVSSFPSENCLRGQCWKPLEFSGSIIVNSLAFVDNIKYCNAFSKIWEMCILGQCFLNEILILKLQVVYFEISGILLQNKILMLSINCIFWYSSELHIAILIYNVKNIQCKEKA